jgi:hypothetical protein
LLNIVVRSPVGTIEVSGEVGEESLRIVPEGVVVCSCRHAEVFGCDRAFI